jgi:hypothetical protein
MNSLRADVAKFGNVVRTANIKVDPSSLRISKQLGNSCDALLSERQLVH